MDGGGTSDWGRGGLFQLKLTLWAFESAFENHIVLQLHRTHFVLS